MGPKRQEESIPDDSSEIKISIFRSAAVGKLDEIEQLLAAGVAHGTVCFEGLENAVFSVCSAKFQASVSESLGSAIAPSDVEIQKVEEVMKGARTLGAEQGRGVDAAFRHCLLVTFTIKPSGAIPASDFRARVLGPSFLSSSTRLLEEKLRNETAFDPSKFSKWSWHSEIQHVRCSVHDRDEDGRTALHWAAVNDRTEIISFLLQRGAEISVEDYEEQTPLHWAALKGRTKASYMLVRGGAAVNSQDRWGFSPLMRAVQGGFVITMMVLLQGGGATTIQDHEGHTALHWAVFKRDHNATRWLLRDGGARAEIDVQDEKGATALHLACRWSGWEMVRKLLAAGADPSLLDQDNRTPLQVAVKYKRHSVANSIWWYQVLPRFARSMIVARGKSERAYELVPTGTCQWAAGIIVCAYVYYALVLSATKGGIAVLLAHALLLGSTPPMIFYFYYSWKGDPGIIAPQPETVIQEIVQDEIAEDEVLPTAMSPKHPRAKYSRFFNCYVARFDHDCPWISNVVGAGNHGYFMGFVFFVTICLGAWLFLCGAYIWQENYSAALASCGVPSVNSTGTHLSPQIAASRPKASKRCPRTAHFVRFAISNQKIIAIMFIIYTTFFTFTLIMCLVQAQQISQNATTNELVNHHRYDGWRTEEGKFFNPYDRGLIKNVREFWQRYPAYPWGENLGQKKDEGARGRQSVEMVSLLDNSEGDKHSDDSARGHVSTKQVGRRSQASSGYDRGPVGDEQA